MQSDASKTDSVRQVLHVLNKELGTGTPQYVGLLFLEIASDCERDGKCDQRNLRKRLGLPRAVISRALSSLGPKTPRKMPGLGLLEFRPDYEDMRRKPVVLTTKGRRLLEKLAQALDAAPTTALES